MTDPTTETARRERYAVAIHDAMETDLSLVDQAPAYQALIACAAEAAEGVADAEQAELRRERDLAIAHDRQPYPTAWAYEQACKALRRKTEAIERVRAVADAIDAEMRVEPDTQRAAMQMEAVTRIRAALDGHELRRMADEAPQPEPAAGAGQDGAQTP